MKYNKILFYGAILSSTLITTLVGCNNQQNNTPTPSLTPSPTPVMIETRECSSVYPIQEKVSDTLYICAEKNNTINKYKDKIDSLWQSTDSGKTKAIIYLTNGLREGWIPIESTKARINVNIGNSDDVVYENIASNMVNNFILDKAPRSVSKALDGEGSLSAIVIRGIQQFYRDNYFKEILPNNNIDEKTKKLVVSDNYNYRSITSDNIQSISFDAAEIIGYQLLNVLEQPSTTSRIGDLLLAIENGNNLEEAVNETYGISLDSAIDRMKTNLDRIN